MELLAFELSEVVGVGSLLGICRRFPVLGLGFLDQTPNTLKLLKEEFSHRLDISVVVFDFTLPNLFHEQFEKPGVPFPPQRRLIPVGYIWWRRTRARPIHFELDDIVVARWSQFQEAFVVDGLEERPNVGPTKFLPDEVSACKLNSEERIIILTRASVLPSSRDLSTGTLKTREIAGEDLGEWPVLFDIRPLDTSSHNFPT